MKVRNWLSLLIAALLVLLAMAPLRAQQLGNFTVTGGGAEFNETVRLAAEQQRRELAVYWLGQELPRWAAPCPISLHVGDQVGAGGATNFVFDHGDVFNWQMSIQGTRERIIDSVLPHEITHTIFASYFRQPLPRWADEGACTTVEHSSERGKMTRMLGEFLQTKRGIAFTDMFAMREYPEDVMPLYSQGYSVSRFLLEHAGPQQFVAFIGAGLQSGDWSAAVKQAYGYEDLGHLQSSWVVWLRNGSPRPVEHLASEQHVTMKQGDCANGNCHNQAGADRQVTEVPMMRPGRVYVHQGSDGYVGWQYAGGGSASQPAVAKPDAPPLVPIEKLPATDSACATLELKLAEMEARLSATISRTVELKVEGLKGEKGDKGDPGDQGPVGPAVEINLEQLAIDAAKHVQIPAGVTKEEMDAAIASAVATVIRELPPFEVEIVDGETGQSLGHTLTRLGQKVTFERFRKEVKRK